MFCEGSNVWSFVRDLARRPGLGPDVVLGHRAPVKDLGLRLFPNGPRKARFWPAILNGGLFCPFHAPFEVPLP